MKSITNPECNMKVCQAYRVAFGEEIRHLRLSHGLTLRQLGEESRLNHRRVSQLERGLTSLSVAEMIALADALQVSPAHILRAARPFCATALVDASLAAEATDSITDEDRGLAAKISSIRDTATRREIVACIERLVEAVLRSQSFQMAQGQPSITRSQSN